MIHFISGTIIGIVMGLTGAGGALIAIPLFLQFLNLNLKEASVLSLLAVVIASLMNFLHQRRYTNFPVATIFVLASTLGSFLSNPYKKIISDAVIASLLIIVSLFALYSVWKPSKIKETIEAKNVSVFITIVIGIFLGVLTTFTGLGGGVLMMPVLLSLYGYNQEEAVATSLLAVSLSSLSSLVIQFAQGAQVDLGMGTISLVAGILIAAISLKWITQRLSKMTMLKIRKVVFTGVVIIAFAKILN